MSELRQNEIDALLRTKASRERAVSSERIGSIAEDASLQHLDADELSAFAENALPAGARSRCAGHLAECDQCRGIAVSLAADSIVSPETLPVTKIQSGGLINRILSIFRIPVVGYGLAALVLAVLSLSIFVPLLTRRERQISVAQIEAPAQQPTAMSRGDSESAASNVASPAGQVAESNAKTASPTIASATPAPSSAATAPPAKGLGTVAESVEVDRQAESSSSSLADEAEKTRKVTELKSSPVTTQSSDQPLNNREEGNKVAAAPPPAPASKPAAEKKEQASDKQKSENEDAKRKEAFGYVAKDANTDDVSRNDSGSGGLISGRRGAARAKSPRDQEPDRDASNGPGAELRTVGGKRFAKSNGEWVDTDFKSSMSPLNVKRASDQYRALIADEPQLRVYSEQLPGPVTVVWKGRAYRFH